MRMKRAVSVSLGSSSRDKCVVVTLGGEPIAVERMGTDGDAQRARQLFAQLDGKVDALGVGGVDLFLRLGEREYPLRAALKLVEDVRHTPVVDGRGLKHTLERRVFELAAPSWGEPVRFRRAFIPLAADRLGLARAVSEVSDELIFGDLMVGLGIPIPVRGLERYYRVARLLMPLVSFLPLSSLYYGNKGETVKPGYQRYWEDADLIAGDFLFMSMGISGDLTEKTIITNTTTAANIEYLRSCGARLVITTTPRYDGRSFGTNLMEAMLTAYAGKGRSLSDSELNALINELDLRPSIQRWSP
jgi:hypothetical protein